MSWITNPARRVTTTVRVNGVERPHEPGGITWAQDITSDLPDTVTAGGQVSQRTGTIVWSNVGVVTRPPNPWYTNVSWYNTVSWSPVTGDPVTVDVSDGTNTHRVFTGVIDTVEGDAFGRRSSKIVAEVRGSNKVIRRGALTQAGGLPGGAVGRFTTTPVWVVSEIARELGYESVPPAPPASKLILDAPLQGSTYNYSQAPNVNAQVVASGKKGYPTLYPVWSSGGDGFGVSDAVVEWVPNTGSGTGAGSLGTSLLVYNGHSADALVTVTHGTTGYTYVRVLGNKTVRVSTNVGGTTYSETLTAPVPAGDGPHRVSVTYRAGVFRARINGVEQLGNLPTPAGAVTRIKLDADPGACVAGLQLWHPTSTTDHHAPGWAPTAHYRHGTGTHTTVLTPSVRDEKAGDVLQSYADALLSPLWVDGNGHLQVVTGKALHDQGAALAVDALTDVSDLSYTLASLDHRPTVEVTYGHAHNTNLTATTHKTTVWQGGGGEVSPDTPDETFVEVPGDEEWIGLADPTQAGRLDFDTREAFNTGVGTWWGLSEDITDGTLLTPTSSGAQIVETLTPWVWKVTTTFPGAEGAVQKAPSSAYIKRRYRDMDLPIYRARAKVRYEDRTVAVSTPGATTLQGVLSHDAGRWVTTTSAATNLATWVHGMVSKPTPVLDGLRIRFDPRVEVGTKLRVNAQPVFGVDFQALVLSVDHDPGTDTTTVLARVTSVVTYATTIDDVDHANIGRSLANWDASHAGKTLDEVTTTA